MQKSVIRTAFLQKRLALTVQEENRYQDLILIHFQQLRLPFLHAVHSFLPAENRHEPDTEPILRWLQFRHPGLELQVPKISPDGHSLLHYQLEEDTQLLLNRWGIPEPVNGKEADISRIDLILVPLLAFDLEGHRVGYGKGFYDRFLAECPESALRIGLSFFGPVQEIEDTNTFDMKLHFCVTPERNYAFE